MREKMEREKALAEKRTQELLEKMEKYQKENEKYQKGDSIVPIFTLLLVFLNQFRGNLHCMRHFEHKSL